MSSSDPNERLRARRLDRPFHIALVEPEIPPNTGNVARLCAATCCPLHLIGKLGFSIDEHAVRRAGLDYWPLVQVHRHDDFASFHTTFCQAGSGKAWLFSGKAEQSYLDARFELGDALVFGCESVGLSEALLIEHAPRVVGIPTLGGVRSHNLANSVAIAVYEALRQVGALEVDPSRRSGHAR